MTAEHLSTAPAGYVPGGDHNAVVDQAFRREGMTYRHPWMAPVEFSIPIYLDWENMPVSRDLPWPHDVFVHLVSNHVGNAEGHLARALAEQAVPAQAADPAFRPSAGLGSGRTS